MQGAHPSSVGAATTSYAVNNDRIISLQGEDVALALELQCKGHTSCYLHECLAVGEVPTSIRAICMQKSRCVCQHFRRHVHEPG